MTNKKRNVKILDIKELIKKNNKMLDKMDIAASLSDEEHLHIFKAVNRPKNRIHYTLNAADAEWFENLLNAIEKDIQAQGGFFLNVKMSFPKFIKLIKEHYKSEEFWQAIKPILLSKKNSGKQ